MSPIKWMIVLLTCSIWSGGALSQIPDPAQLDCPWPKHSFYIRAMAEVFAGAQPVEKPVNLEVKAEPVGPVGVIFAGDDKHPALTHKDVFAFLPFQTQARCLVIPVYVMTYDVTQHMPEETYRLTIKGLPAPVKVLQLVDPIFGKQEQL